MGTNTRADAMNEMLGPGMELLNQVNRIKRMNGIQARFIYDRIRY
jgi:hypothetical protein